MDAVDADRVQQTLRTAGDLCAEVDGAPHHLVGGGGLVHSKRGSIRHLWMAGPTAQADGRGGINGSTNSHSSSLTNRSTQDRPATRARIQHPTLHKRPTRTTF